MSVERNGPEAPPMLDRASAELVLSLSVEADEWVPRRYGYMVGPFGFLVAEATRSEVVKAPRISPLPHSPEWLRGLMNLRGNLVPVADLRALCGEPPDARPPAMVLVLDADEQAVAIPIESLPVSLAELQPLAAPPLLPDTVAAFAGRAFTGEGRAWLEFEHDRLFRALARGEGAHS